MELPRNRAPVRLCRSDWNVLTCPVSLGSIPILLISPSCTLGWPAGTYPTTCAIIKTGTDLVWYVDIPGNGIIVVRGADPWPTPTVG